MKSTLRAAALAAATAFCALSAAPAFAAPPEGASVATLAKADATTPVTIIDGRRWACSAGVCSASSSPTADSQPMSRECLRAARILGAFSAYQTGARSMTADQLAACNASAKK